MTVSIESTNGAIALSIGDFRFDIKATGAEMATNNKL